MENIRDKVCKNFNRLLDKSGMKSREVARLAEVSEATIQRWKTAVNAPELENMEKLAKIFGVNVLEFFEGEKQSAKAVSASSAIRKFASIPDEIYDLAEKLNDPNISSKSWETVQVVLQGYINKAEASAGDKASGE